MSGCKSMAAGIKRASGQTLVEFLLIALPTAMALGCLMLLLERFYVARELEHEAALAGLAALHSQSSRPLLRCAHNSTQTRYRSLESASRCRSLGRSVRLER